jgi:hypothetical protein
MRTPLWFWAEDWNGDWLWADSKWHHYVHVYGHTYLDGRLMEIRDEN